MNCKLLLSLISIIGIKGTTTTTTKGLLYPRESESREVHSLDGVWRFLKSNITQPLQGVTEQWYLSDLDKIKPTIPMPVPASYNDITTAQELRDHVGTVWYERKFFVPRSWALMEKRIWLRFGSVHYAAIVWLNGLKIGSHAIGHLPFEMEITTAVKFGAENRLTLMCDNTLVNTTIPQGQVMEEPSDSGHSVVQTYTFDFFNYAGIHRSVVVYTTPNNYIEDVHIEAETQLEAQQPQATLYYTIATAGASEESNQGFFVHIQLRDRQGVVVANQRSNSSLQGVLQVDDVQLWWPYLMHPQPGYLYTFEIYLHDSATAALLDVYRLKYGIRTLQWNSTSLLMNTKPLYLRGFGRHEDSDIRGKGLDFALLTRDFNLLKWIGANAYRTSHYPYSEESMQFADEHGIMIIDECSSVNTDIFDDILRVNHESALEQLIHRDRNHASVIMWSIANEPRSAKAKAENYFRLVANYTKSLDKTRPITAAINQDVTKDKLAQFLDVISFNRYNAWYHNAGHLDMITKSVIDEATAWHQRHKKPIVMTEYGADTLEGLHILPAYIWSEDYQEAILSKHFKAFDALRAQKWFIGEFLWNFADFKTEQTYTRVGGNKKGIFTRNRQPKAAAHLLRKRNYALAYQLDHCPMPDELFAYVINWSRPHEHNEL